MITFWVILSRKFYPIYHLRNVIWQIICCSTFIFHLTNLTIRETTNFCLKKFFAKNCKLYNFRIFLPYQNCLREGQVKVCKDVIIFFWTAYYNCYFFLKVYCHKSRYKRLFLGRIFSQITRVRLCIDKDWSYWANILVSPSIEKRVQWFYLTSFTSCYRWHSQSKNGLIFPNVVYSFPNIMKKVFIFSQM